MSATTTIKKKKYGVSEAISEEGPTPQDLVHTEQLINVLKEFKLFESDEESKKREEVLATLNQVVQEWAKEICQKKVCLLVYLFVYFDWSRISVSTS